VHRQIEHPMTRDLIPENVTLSKGKTLPDFIEDGPAGPMVSALSKP